MEKITEGKIRLAQASKLPAIPYKLKGTKIIVFDTETTGVTEDDEIIPVSYTHLCFWCAIITEHQLSQVPCLSFLPNAKHILYTYIYFTAWIIW